MTKATVAQYIARTLQRHGRQGDLWLGPPSAVTSVRNDGHFATRVVKGMGGSIADSFARASDQVAVVAAQSGPAETLLLLPLAKTCSKRADPLLRLCMWPKRYRRVVSRQSITLRLRERASVATLITAPVNLGGRASSRSQLLAVLRVRLARRALK